MGKMSALNSLLKTGVDIGGTHLRIGFVGGNQVFHYYHSKIKRSLKGHVLLNELVQEAAAYILKKTACLEKAGKRVIRQVGVSAPGAYMQDGHVFPGTVPNIPVLKKAKLFQLFSKALGHEWHVTASHVNNDGVLQGWYLADFYVKAGKMKQGKIVALVPGTGFGGGVYHVARGVAQPVPGPQQLFDVVLKNNSMKNPLMMEDLVTGRALALKGTALLGRSVTGEALSELALCRRGGACLRPSSKEGNQKSKIKNQKWIDESSIACQIFKEAGEDLAGFIELAHTGVFKKAVVPFKPDTRGVRVFLIGGNWLLSGAGRKISLRAAREKLKDKGFSIVPVDEMKGFEQSAKYLGVLAASMLVKN